MLRSIFSTVSLHFPSFSIYLVSFEIHSPHFSLISNSICLIYPLSNFSNFYPIFFFFFFSFSYPPFRFILTHYPTKLYINTSLWESVERAVLH